MDLTRSRRLYAEARRFLVEGVNSPVRSFKAVGGEPLVMKRGRRAKLFDADGHAFTDYCLSWGALILGHAHPRIMAEIKAQLKEGTSFGTTTAAETELARFIVKNVPSVSKVRFVNSGTEAAMSAIRLARGYTRRNKIVKFDGCYHGHFDDLLVKAGSGVSSLKASSSLGITKNHIRETITLPYNDTPALVETLEKNRRDVSCVIIEPVAGNMGVVVPDMEFLKVLRKITKKYRIVLIFDEVMTGFRASAGCVQSEFGVEPDLTCFGKIIGGGFPIGAYGGEGGIMRYLAPSGGVYQAGTFAGNPVVMRAGWATLDTLKGGMYRKLNALCARFAEDMNAFFVKNDIPVHLDTFHSMMSVRFSRAGVTNYREVLASSDRAQYGRLFQFLLNSGIYWPPAELETFFVSAVHTVKELDAMAKALKTHVQTKGGGE